MSPERMTAEEREHEEMNLLLPWYQNGTLEAGDRGRVESHLAACHRCRAELALVRATEQAVHEINEAEPAPSPWAYNRLAARIDEAEARRPRARLAAWWNAVWNQPVPVPAFRRLAAVAVLLLVVQLAAIGVLSTRGGGREGYRVLSGPAACQAPAACIQVVFQEGASEQAVREVLIAARARLVDGPTALGRYTVAPEEGAGGAEAVERLLAALRAKPAVVRFAERAP